MLRKIVRFRLISYVENEGEAQERERIVKDRFEVIKSMYSEEWCLQNVSCQITQGKNNNNCKAGFKYRMIWYYESSKATLDSIIKYFDIIEIAVNNNPVFFIEIAEES